LGSASITSAKPPVFEKGKPSEATNRIRIACIRIPRLQGLKPGKASGVNVRAKALTP
jgi:hypothetical protein